MSLQADIARLTANAPNRTLDQLWENVNVLGTCCPSGDYEQGYSDAIGHALAEIEAMGGMDPMVRRFTDTNGGTS